MQVVDFTGLMMQVCHQFDSSLLASGDLVFADLLQVVETTCIKLVDKKSWQSTCIKPLDNLQQSVQVIRTHPDIGLIILTSKKPASDHWRRQNDNWRGEYTYICAFCLINFFWNRLFYSLWTRIYEYLPPQLSFCRRQCFRLAATCASLAV